MFLFFIEKKAVSELYKLQLNEDYLKDYLSVISSDLPFTIYDSQLFH